MAANFLEDHLRFLHESLSESSTKKDQAPSIIDDLNQICIQEITEKDIDFTCSCLFDKDNGLVHFLNKSVTNQELPVQCKSRSLEFLAAFLEKVEKKIIPYAVDIKDVTVSLFFREKAAKVKCAAIPVLIKLLELTVGSTLGDKLQLDKMINRFFSELSTSKTPKPSATVKQGIYQVLGVIAEVYPEYMTPYAERLTGLYLSALKAEMGSKTRKPELSVIEGCLEGLSCSLVNFTESADEGSKNAYEIYKYARNAIDPKLELTRYGMPQAALKLFARHASQFNQYLIEDYQVMYDKLSFWSHHKNLNMLHLGLRAMEAFLTQVSDMLKEKAQGGTEEGGAVFKFFVRQFREIMHDEKASSKELSLAIKGYGLLAAPCKIYLGESDVQFMFSEILTKTEQQFIGQPEDIDTKLFSLASFLESLASIVREMSSVSEAYAMSLEHLMVLLVDNLPTIPEKTHFLCIKSLLLVLLALMPKGTTFKQVLSGFVYQSLIRTCSYQPLVEVEGEGESTLDQPLEQKVTYRNFLGLWSGMMDAPKMKEFGALDITLETRHQLTDAFYSEIITAVLKILDKLDLTSATALPAQQTEAGQSAKNTEEAVTSADPLLGVRASRPQDFQIFINLVDFCQELLPEKNYEKFESWVFPFSHKLILMSTENALASGFYKLLSVCMKVANKLGYFETLDTSAGSVSDSEVAMDTEDSGAHEGVTQKHTCYMLIKKFAKEVLVRMKQYRDELLAACLTFILSLPKEVVADQMASVVPAIQVTLKLGLSYLPLAMVAMDALEVWSRSLPGHVIRKHYKDILPFLDSYLKTREQGADDVNVESAVTTNKSSSGKGRRKLPVRLVKGQKDKINKSYQSQLALVKQRIVRYLGQLGGSVNAALLANTDADIAVSAIAWDTEKHLKFDMPFVDMKPTIYLDPFLPRVCELATTSSDRQTKVAACELLHSLILYSIGRGAAQPGVKVERSSMAPLFKHLFPSMLKLACDVELVSRQLFEPLTMQLIHWFTGSKKTESDETMTLLDAIYDGMIQQSDTALRDFCARCLHEFLKWSIKQTSEKMAETNPANAKSVLKRLYSYALHPCPFKRLGAALAFNNIYTIFREEEALVNLFTFELLVHFVESLAIAHADEKSLGTQEQCCKALEHLEKIIRHKAPLLKVKHKQRTQPRNWSSVTLEICVRWLTRQCGRPQTECRHACMKLSYQLCTLLGGIKTPAKFFLACLKGKGPEYWIQRFEGGGHAGSVKYGIEGAPHLTDQSDVFSLQTVQAWFDNVLAALDCYTWVFGENLLSPGELFGTPTKDGSKSQMFVALEYFIQKVALADIAGVAKLFPHKTDTSFFTPRETDDFNRSKCTVIVRLFTFLMIMLAKYKKETLAVTPKSLWSSNVWELLCSCVVRPGDVGFNLGDVDVMTNLPQEMRQTLDVFSKTFRAEMIKHFTTFLTGDRDLFSKLPIDLTDSGTNHVQLQQVLAGYQQLHDVDLLLPCLQGQSGVKAAASLLDNVFKGVVCVNFGETTAVTLTPVALGVAKTMLKLALSMGINTGTLLERMFDCNKVSRGSMKDSEQTHGDLFFTTFRTTVSQHCVSRVGDLLQGLVTRVDGEPGRVCAVLTATIECLTKDRELRKKQGSTAMKSVLQHWPRLSGWWGPKSSSDTQGMAIMLLTKLLLIDSKFVTSPDEASFKAVFNMYFSMLTDKNTKMSFKCRVLDLLPFFAGVPEPHSNQLKESLDRFVADNFPLRSSELVKGSPQYLSYISALDKILAGFQLSGSLMLLEYLIRIFCREPVHIHEEAIQASITKFIRRLGRDKQKAALDVPYGIFVKTGGYTSEIRRAVIERVCLTMLRLVNKSVVIEFFTDHIVHIKELIEVKLSKSSEAVLEGQLITRMGCFQLLETMYSRLTKDEVVGPTSVINKVFAGGNPQTNKELTSFVSKQAHEAKGEDVRGETGLLELRRQYHCTAYNLMIAFISRTQTELKFYTALLFEEKEAKGQFLLENFVDKERNYEFQAELMSPMERKKRFVSIHREVREGRRGDGEEDSVEGSTSSSYHLASQYLAESSLSEDVSQYFSMSGTIGSLSGAKGRARGHAKPSASPEEERQTTEELVEEDYVVLEMDALNQHECMANMISVVKHMQQTNISPEPKPGTGDPALPSWMEKLHAKMTNSRTHLNIKLFIAKLIINTAKVFAPFACHWLQPLTQLIVSGPLGSSTINYFITDLIVTMLSWHKTAIPRDTTEEKAMSSRLVHYIVKNIYHDNRQVFRNNLEMLKTLLECWKPRLEIPYQEVYGQFSSADPKNKESLVGIQVLGVVIACKFPPYGSVAPVDRDRYYSKVANNMQHHNKTTYAPAAEVCGMIFQHLADREGETDGPLHAHVANLMMNLHKGRPDTFIVCVHRMQKHYPPIADRFVNKLLFMLPQLHGEFRSLCLEVLHARIDSIENVFLELKSKGIMAALAHRDEATQLISLRIVKAILAKLKSSEVTVVMPLITAFTVNPSTACRNVMYEILMWIYDNYRYEDSAEAHKIIQLTKESLLKGLGDDDLHCRLQVQNFWSSETRLPVGTLDRLVAMLEAMYSPVTEQQYLSYATNLILEMTSKSPDYQREIFEHPLSECKFSDYSVSSSWRHRHAAMTPLFATQASQSVMTEEDNVDGVRATQDAQQFSQTQEQGAHKGPFNWLTQSSLDTYADASVPFTMETQNTASTLLFTLGTSGSQGAGPRRVKPGAGFGKQKLAAPKTAAHKKEKETEDGSDLFRLKRRFLKDKESTQIYFAKKNRRINEMREAARLEQKAKRESHVTMYRKYRSGDLPDIQIKYSYIIAPLQALAHRDSTVAKLLLSAIFQAIFANRDEVKTEREINEVTDQINTSLDQVLSASTQYYPPFIGCVLDILYKLRQTLKVENVSTLGGSTVFSMLQPLGIVVLEEQLILHENTDPRAAKRGRMDTSPVSQDAGTWIELARLYKSVEEYDVLLGIFSSKIGTKPITQKAIEAEARGDYSSARKFYDEAMNCHDWPDGNPLDVELDLWEKCQMECLSRLSQWDALETMSLDPLQEGSTVVMSKVWDDTYLQEHFLPFIMKSKVKLLLQGDTNQQTLLDFIDASMRTPEQKLALESGYGTELALLYLWQEDYDRARHYCNTALDTFLQEWSSTDILMTSSRATSLQKLQPLVELQEFLSFISVAENFRTPRPASALVEKWTQRTPHYLADPVTIWDDVVTNRIVYMDQLSSKLQRQEDSQNSMETEADDMFLQTKLALKLKMADSCREQNNFALTLKILKDTQGECKRSADGATLCSWTHLYASTHQKKVQSSLEPMTVDSLNSLCTTLDQLGKVDGKEALRATPSLLRTQHALGGHGRKLLALGLQGLEARDLAGSKAEQKLLDYTGLPKFTKLEVMEKLVSDGYQQMKGSLSVEGEDVSTTDRVYSQDQAYLDTAKYCDTFLRMKEDDEIDVGGACLKQFPETVVMCLLRAMKLDNTEARQRFPRLLQLVEQHPDVMATFLSKSKEVPSWMFMLWTSQMLAILDKPEARAVHDIVLNITENYPQAMVYAMKLSLEGYSFGDGKTDKLNKSVVDKLVSLLGPEKVPLADRFISSLECLWQPDLEVKDAFEDMIKLMKKKKKEEVKQKYLEFYNRIFDYAKRETQERRAAKGQSVSGSGDTSATEEDESLASSQTGVDIGSYTRKFADKFKAEFDKRFGPGGNKLLTMTLKDLSIHRSELGGRFEEEVKAGASKKKASLLPPEKLSEYSKWMAEFNPNTHGRDLEIPGQYSGLSKPMPEYHIKISGFDQRVKVMTSLRRPKRVTIRGNDEKDYHFLVKGGEDLRQDQRIEQLFYVMNQVFKKDPACRNRSLLLKTYQVIPMTARVGLIEWISDTIPLKDFIYMSLTEQEKKAFQSEHGPTRCYGDWVRKPSKANEKNYGVIFANLFKKYSMTETTRHLKIIESKVPWDLLRRSFQNMSTGPEAFHVLRTHCMKTHAMLCICQYVIGIGDRHLSNFMVNLKTGEMVGIDFGHAFGSATQFLPVPELMPFRLTRQLCNLMLPLQSKGLVESTMIHVLRALRSDWDLLLNTMDIFVKEPSLDWKQNAEKQIQTMDSEDVELYSQESQLMDWYPKEKIQYVKRKLKGENPARITRDELYLGHGKKTSFKDFETVALGDKKVNVRAQLPDLGLSIEQQVAALIDQATDPNILGRTWMGWEPFI